MIHFSHPFLGTYEVHQFLDLGYLEGTHSSVAAAPAQSQLKPEAELSLAKAQPELPSGGSHISANSGSS